MYNQKGGKEMPVKFFCNKCGKEIWEYMDQLTKETTTISEAERSCTCSDCGLEMIRASQSDNTEKLDQ